MKAISVGLCILGALSSSFAAPAPKVNAVHHPKLSRPQFRKRNGYSNAVNVTSTAPITSAPKANVWASLSNDEAASVISFLHDQPSLNLTAAQGSGEWDNAILVVDLAHVNKGEAMSYLSGTGPAPDRYAKATISFGATEEPYYQDFYVGPIGGNMTYTSYDWVTTTGTAKIRNYDADYSRQYERWFNLSMEVEDIIQDLLNATVADLDIWGIDPLWHEEGRVINWLTYWRQVDGFDASTLQPQGLFFKWDGTGRDPSGWGLIGWLYNDVYYASTEEFRAAWQAGKIEKATPNMGGDWVTTDKTGPDLPFDTLPPPVQIQPAGQRFAVDEEQKYVEWGDFTFYITFTRDTGLRLFNIKFKNETILYELGLQEAIAHYAGNDPVQSGIGYLDSYYGFGPWSFNLVKGMDCPTYAHFLPATWHADELSKTHPMAICLFESDMGYLMQRHSSSEYVSATKNIGLVVRTVATVGNYDYSFDYTFYHDGSLETTVRASGYIQSAYYSKNDDYGYHIHDGLSGSMHDHVLTFKADFDIMGTANTLAMHSVVPAEVKYSWANATRSTMKLDKKYLENEDQSKIGYDHNGQTMYVVVNKDSVNKFGEQRGYRISPKIGGAHHLTIQESPNLHNAQHFATHPLYVTKQKDTEPNCANPYNNLDTRQPLVDFNKFFDGESLVQEDLVIWANIAMHHVPITGDLPTTTMSFAQGSLVFSPHNYLYHDASRQTAQQIRIRYNNENVTEVETFGAKPMEGMVDLAATAFDLWDYTGDVAVRKFPYDPLNPFNDTVSI
ncbi:hypothetical protein NliqN6_2643 [Naganishia liquefaciens]|uniref:Amine oxidase n=1 Tax=Naganishia liquefaciens TaxID=104408 RepID=A0A8H3TSM4_9TREE|nr:hypothetical protein NliqN6_2643 [Naganishia liquefaciens]